MKDSLIARFSMYVVESEEESFTRVLCMLIASEFSSLKIATMLSGPRSIGRFKLNKKPSYGKNLQSYRIVRMPR